MKRRVLACLLAAAMAATMLTGCGGKETSAPAAESTAAEEEAATAEESAPEASAIDFDEEPYEVVMEYMYFGNLRQDFEMIQGLLSDYAKEKVNCTVSLIPVSMFEADTTMSLMMSGGEKLDLMISMGATGFQNLVNRGQAIELDDLYAQYGADIKESMGVAMMGGYVNGKLYGIPSLDKFARESGFIGLADIMDKYGLETRQEPTYEQLDTWFAAVKEGEGANYYPLILSGNNITTFNNFKCFDTLGSSVASGVILRDEIDTPVVVNLFETEEYRQHCEWMHKWYEAGYINPDALTASETSQDLINAGKGAIYNSYTELNMLPMQGSVIHGNLDKITMVTKYTTQEMLNGQNWVITANSDRPDKAMQFLNLLYQDEYFINLLYYGVEGTHWEKSDREGFINPLNGMDFSNGTWGWNLGLFGAVMKCYQYDDPGYPDTYFQDLVEFDNLKPEESSPYLGYTFNGEEYKTEIAAVNDVITQYRSALEVGAVDPEETLPQFIEALKSAGIDTIIEANQKALDEWLAAN